MIRIAAVVGLAVAVLGACSSSIDERFAAACDDAIKARLIAPSGYKRISDSGPSDRIAVASAQLTQTALGLGLKLSQEDYDALGDANADPAIFQRVIEYDAPNAYNAPIRAKAKCLFFSINGKMDGQFDRRMGIDFLNSSRGTR